ncbi:MAG: hypothetical protein ACREDM_12340 [Methylocella sp.]
MWLTLAREAAIDFDWDKWIIDLYQKAELRRMTKTGRMALPIWKII